MNKTTIFSFKNKIKTSSCKNPLPSFPHLNQTLLLHLTPSTLSFFFNPVLPYFWGWARAQGQSPRQLAGGGRAGGWRPVLRHTPAPPTPRDQNPQESPSLPMPTAACHGRHWAQARAAVAGDPRPSPAKSPKPRSTPYTRWTYPSQLLGPGGAGARGSAATPGGRARPRRRARVPAVRDHEPTSTRLLHHLWPLEHLLDKPSMTQNPGNLELTGDLGVLRDGEQNGDGGGAAAAVVDGKG